MKKLIYGILATVLVLNLFSCSSKKYSFRTKVRVSPNELVQTQKLNKSSDKPLNSEINENRNITIQTNSNLDSELQNPEELVISASSEVTILAKQKPEIGSETTNIVLPNQNNTPTKNIKKTIKTVDDGGTDGMSIAGFICSIAGLFIAGLILGILGIVFSSIGLARTSNGKKGKGFAIAGLVVGIIDVVIILMLLSTI
jgi:hypothetical protein